MHLWPEILATRPPHRRLPRPLPIDDARTHQSKTRFESTDLRTAARVMRSLAMHSCVLPALRLADRALRPSAVDESPHTPIGRRILHPWRQPAGANIVVTLEHRKTA